MAPRFRHGLGTAGQPRPLQAETPVAWVTKVNNEVGYRTSYGSRSRLTRAHRRLARRRSNSRPGRSTRAGRRSIHRRSGHRDRRPAYRRTWRQLWFPHRFRVIEVGVQFAAVLLAAPLFVPPL